MADLRFTWKIHSSTVIGLVIGTVVTIVVAAIVFYAQKRERKLVYVVNSVRTTIVNSKETSAVRVLYNDKELKGDVTGLAVAVWNQGNASIRSENLERPVTIRLVPAALILEVRLSKPSRADITQIKADTSRQNEGVVSLTWNILEHNDGTTVQVIYAGSANIPVEVRGTVEEQGEITEDVSKPNRWRIISAMAVMVLGVVGVLFDFTKGFKPTWLQFASRVLFVVVVLSALFATEKWLAPSTSGPPAELGGPNFTAAKPPTPPGGPP